MPPPDIGYMIGLLAAVTVLLVFSGLFSGTETAVTAANKVRLRTMEADGNKRAGKVLKRLENFDRAVSALLIGNNIVNLTAASLSTLLFLELIQSTSIATTVSTVSLTLAVLIFCEVTPKIVARVHPEKTAVTLSPFLTFSMVLFFPLTWFFAQWKKLLQKIFRLKADTAITEDELLEYVETAANEGSIEQHESSLIKSAIEFEDVAVEDIMVPRVYVVAVDDTLSVEEVKAAFKKHEFSRMPVFHETVDTVIGILHEKDFQKYVLSGKKKLKDSLQLNLSVARTMKISVVLRMMQKARVHMAVVVDEFGGTSGIVTLEDILEELVGEIFDEHDEVEVLMRKSAPNVFIVAGTESVNDMLDTLGVKRSEECKSSTVGGFVTELAGKIPASGDTVNYENLTVTVTKANAKRVLEVRVKKETDKEEDA